MFSVSLSCVFFNKYDTFDAHHLVCVLYLSRHEHGLSGLLEELAAGHRRDVAGERGDDFNFNESNGLVMVHNIYPCIMDRYSHLITFDVIFSSSYSLELCLLRIA